MSKGRSSQKRRPVMLVVLDGWGCREEADDNAVRLARTPTFDQLWATAPHALLSTSGKDVGLPDGQMGNSEVGHLNIGAGRIAVQDLPRIEHAIATGEIARSSALLELIQNLKNSCGTCHLIGLISPGGVHSHQNHALVLSELLVRANVPTAIHVVTDGRDTSPQSAYNYLQSLITTLPPQVAIATVLGRYYGMDRDKRWDRVSKAYEAIVEGQGPRFPDPLSAIRDSYDKGIHDEFILPSAIGRYDGMRNGDGVLCFNFRADRVREILSALLDPDFTDFPRSRTIHMSAAVGMMPYGDRLDTLLKSLLPPQRLVNVLGEVVANTGLKQLRMAETEKYPHVTYFLNGGREAPYVGEERILIPSPNVATYDIQPEMSAPELTDRAVEAILSNQFDLIVLNYANPDMVGHTGSLPAAIKAVQAVDAGLGRLRNAIAEVGGLMLVTADHGNCELMRDPQTGGPHTAHTTNPVPVLLVGQEDVALSDGRLSDIAATLLELMGLPKPAEITGRSLIRVARGHLRPE